MGFIPSILIFTLFFSQMRGETNFPSPEKWVKTEMDDLRWELKEWEMKELQAFVKSTGLEAPRAGIKSQVEKDVNAPSNHFEVKTLFLDVDSVRRIMNCTDIKTNKKKIEKLGTEIFNLFKLFFEYTTQIINDIDECTSALKMFQCAKQFSYEFTYGFAQFGKNCKKIIQNLRDDGPGLVKDVVQCLHRTKNT